MALEQRGIAETAQDNMNTMIGGVLIASQNMQAIASEFAQMSLESIENATQVADRFSKARSWDQFLDIQNKFLKSSIDTLAQHSAKVAELMTAWPGEMGKTYQRVSKKMVEAGGEAAKAAADSGGRMAQQTASAGAEAAGAVSSYGH